MEVYNEFIDVTRHNPAGVEIIDKLQSRRASILEELAGEVGMNDAFANHLRGRVAEIDDILDAIRNV